MSESAVYLQPAFILQHRPYRETSRLLEVYTRDFGIVSVLAKGVRQQKSKLAGMLLPFSLLHISYLDKSELKILTQTEFVCNYALQRLALYCGFYLNELLQRFLFRNDPHPELFAGYQACLGELREGLNIEQALRYFELEVLEACGYAVDLVVDHRDQEVDRLSRYSFKANVGLVEDGEGCISGASLRMLSVKTQLQGAALLEAKQFLRAMLDVHLQGKPLQSREVLAKMIKYL
ncbi:MAG: DNA repair protein RecO [Methylomonas sp.]|jgi:DNA repair protein RecO (recombination protein O)|uniref:DNA repair protein RecO n=1 Tax=Methylomonas sp. TaxID=418 RepID=UPI0025ED79F6|nr:DNA repair protein RecO [Methylomonas sp.]MCK9608574.1 DNA repair protein RecO [Methylomonas sp.]